jgi:hypothetical protein
VAGSHDVVAVPMMATGKLSGLAMATAFFMRAP